MPIFIAFSCIWHLFLLCAYGSVCVCAHAPWQEYIPCWSAADVVICRVSLEELGIFDLGNIHITAFNYYFLTFVSILDAYPQHLVLFAHNSSTADYSIHLKQSHRFPACLLLCIFGCLISNFWLLPYICMYVFMHICINFYLYYMIIYYHITTENVIVFFSVKR